MVYSKPPSDFELYQRELLQLRKERQAEENRLVDERMTKQFEIVKTQMHGILDQASIEFYRDLFITRVREELAQDPRYQRIPKLEQLVRETRSADLKNRFDFWHWCHGSKEDRRERY